jgi:hypothetical protein
MSGKKTPEGRGSKGRVGEVVVDTEPPVMLAWDQLHHYSHTPPTPYEGRYSR